MTLADRMRTAADTLAELSALYGYRFPAEAGWSASELRHEAQHVEADYPGDYEGCSGALAYIQDEP
jgi:hypothetical protein